MENHLFFKEKQQFSKWWVWLILITLNGLYLFGIFRQLILGKPFGKNAMTDSMLLITFALIFMISILFYFTRLDTEVRKDGIQVRFFPFHMRYRHYTWDSIHHWHIRKYSAFLEYGGWGFKFGLFGRGKAFTLSGNQGLQLEFNNQKKLLIGTHKPKELEEAIQAAHLPKYTD